MFTLVVLGVGDPRTSSLDPATGNLYIAQASANIAQVAIVRGKAWVVPIALALPSLAPTARPSGQPTRQPTGKG